MHDFWLSLMMIFVAEMGDKTQLVSLALATRFNTRTVLLGIFSATLLVHVFSAALGNVAGTLLPTHWVQFGSGLAFIGFGFWTLRGDSLDDDPGHGRRIRSPFLLVATVFFLAELGDKTMLGTVTLATTGAFVPVWLGSSLGMVVADGLAIVVGKTMGARLPARHIKIGAALVFFAFGLWGAIDGGMHLHPLIWALGLLLVGLMCLLLLWGRKDPEEVNQIDSAPLG